MDDYEDRTYICANCDYEETVTVRFRETQSVTVNPTNENAERCYQRAFDAAQKAVNTREARDRQFWLERESYWLYLATSHEYTEGRSMIALNDTQVQTIMTAAADLPTEKRDLFLKRIEAARRFMHRGHLTDDELNATINVALRGLRHDVTVPPE